MGESLNASESLNVPEGWAWVFLILAHQRPTTAAGIADPLGVSAGFICS